MKTTSDVGVLCGGEGGGRLGPEYFAMVNEADIFAQAAGSCCSWGFSPCQHWAFASATEEALPAGWQSCGA